VTRHYPASQHHRCFTHTRSVRRASGLVHTAFEEVGRRNVGLRFN